MHRTNFNECTDIPQDSNKIQTPDTANISAKSDISVQAIVNDGDNTTDTEDDKELEKFFNDLVTELMSKDTADTADADDDDDEDSGTDDTDDDDEEEDDDDENMKELIELEKQSPDDDDELPDDDFVTSNGNRVKVVILPPLKEPEKELNKLIGCKNVKQRIDELIRLSLYNERRLKIDPNAKLHNVSLHGLFIGKPGTGKTTVCKIYGSLLHKAGVLSKGHVVMANRSTFVGHCWGDEEKAVKALIEKAQGGVLMIDEAYLLNGNHPEDPGKMVIPMFMDILADESNRDIAVILCGYKEEIANLIELNPGLHSRFTNTFEFPDFTLEELFNITLMRIKEYKYHFTPSAWEKVKNVLREAYNIRNPRTWGNARYVANMLERIYMNHATRCMEKHIPDKRLSAITVADIKSIDVPKAPKRVGF